MKLTYTIQLGQIKMIPFFQLHGLTIFWLTCRFLLLVWKKNKHFDLNFYEHVKNPVNNSTNPVDEPIKRGLPIKYLIKIYEKNCLPRKKMYKIMIK